MYSSATAAAFFFLTPPSPPQLPPAQGEVTLDAGASLYTYSFAADTPLLYPGSTCTIMVTFKDEYNLTDSETVVFVAPSAFTTSLPAYEVLALFGSNVWMFVSKRRGFGVDLFFGLASARHIISADKKR